MFLSNEHKFVGLANRLHFVVWMVLAAIVLALFAVTHIYDSQNVWSSWIESGDLRNSKYAERVTIENFFRTQANTWSNLAYVIVGLYSIALGWQDMALFEKARANYLVRTPALSLLFGLACCFLGFSSGLFHASLTRVGQQLDVASMYGPLMAIMAIGLGSWIPKVTFKGSRMQIPSWPILAFALISIEWILYQYKWSMSSTTVLVTLLQVECALTILDLLRPFSKRAILILVASVASLVAGVACRQLDVAGRFSGPDTWLQGHSFWHCLTAASLAFMYLYERSLNER